MSPGADGVGIPPKQREMGRESRGGGCGKGVDTLSLGGKGV